jgi:hypothetical protein
MNEATQCLMHYLNCDDWYVACHHGHQFIVHLTSQGAKRYAVCFEGRPPCEKNVYHGSLAEGVSIVPLGQQHDLTPEISAAVKAELIELSHHLPVR